MSRPDPSASPETRSPLRRTWLALAIWAVPMLVITVMVAVNPSHRSVTGVYHKAVQDWMGDKSLYDGFNYHYPPQFALLFAPFHFLPSPVGDVLWRLVCALLLVSGLWRLCEVCAVGDASRAFLWATIASVPLSMPALRNGQANALMAGLFLHAAASVIRKEWGRAVLALVIACAVKELGVVFVLLAVVMYAPLRWRLAAGIAAAVAFPFLFANYSYVIKEYIEAIQHLRACATVTENRFADIGQMARTLGLDLSTAVSQCLRVFAGFGTLAAWWFGGRRVHEPMRGMWLYALVTSYLMVFNPMTEANSYVILAPAMGCWAAWALGDGEKRTAGWVIAGMALSMGLLPNLLRPFFGNSFALFWHPMMAIVFVVIVGAWVFRPSPLDLAANE